MINFFKVLFFSLLCFLIVGCKSNSKTAEKTAIERTDSTDDVRDEQMQHYDQEMEQQNN